MGLSRVGTSLAVSIALLAVAVPSAAATPAVPGPVQTLFADGFETTTADDAAAATKLKDYTGPAPELMTYQADPIWDGSSTIDCNGLIVRGSMTTNPFTGCESQPLAANLMRASARALALVENPALAEDSTEAKANDAVTAATATGADYNDKVQLETKQPLTVAAGRFVNFSVDVGEVACTGPNWARLLFDRIDTSGNAVKLTNTPIVPCPSNLKPDGQGKLITRVADYGYDVYGGRFPSSGSVLSDGSAFRIRMTNDPGDSNAGPAGNNGGDGNDAAIDNLRVIDATPTVDKRFVAPAAGSLRTTLQIFVTNRSDLGAKNGFSFTDSLPAGLTVTPGSQPIARCFAGTTQTITPFTGAGSGSQITVAPGTGALGAGDTHCRIDVDVTAAALGTYTSGPERFGSLVGVDRGSGDTVTFSPAPANAVSPSTALAPRKPQCSDGRDNDGDAAVDRLDPGCSSTADDNEADESVSDLVLCGRGKIRLVRADAKGRRVVLSGVVAPSLAGKKVALTSRFGRKSTRLASVKPKADGTFSGTVAAPPRRQRIATRYTAAVAKTTSVALKLPQTLATSSVRRSGGQIVVKGNVQRNRLGKRNPVEIRRILCGRTKVVGSAVPTRTGAYTVRFAAPSAGDYAFYRAESRVLARPGSKRYVKQYARGVAIKVSGATG